MAKTKNNKGERIIVIAILFSLVHIASVSAEDTPLVTPEPPTSVTEVPVSSDTPTVSLPAPPASQTKETSKAGVPDRVTDLSVERATSKTIVVTWTAPKDNSGKIAGYDIRLSRDPITEDNWDKAISFPGSPSNSVSGVKEKMEFGQLPDETILYIALIAMDATGHTSPLSNVVKALTKTDVASLGTTDSQANNVEPVTSGENVGRVDTTNFGTVKISLITQDNLPIGTPVYVNFINNLSGLSYGGPTTNGLGNYKIPSGDYYVKMVIIDTDYREPENPIMFHIDENGENDLGVVTLRSKTDNDSTSQLVTLANSEGGTSKMLAAIVNLLGEILTTLQKIAVKLSV